MKQVNIPVKRNWADRMRIEYEEEQDEEQDEEQKKGPVSRFVTLRGCEILKEVDEPCYYAIVRLANGHVIHRMPYDVIKNGKRGIQYV